MSDTEQIDAAVLEQMEEVRRIGAVNMMDMRGVREVASAMGCDALVDHIDTITSGSQSQRARGWANALGQFSRWKAARS